MGVMRSDLYLKESFRLPSGEMDCNMARVVGDQETTEVDQVRKDVNVNQGNSGGAYEKCRLTIFLKIKPPEFAYKQEEEYDSMILQQ